MANHASAEKRIRRNERCRVVNHARMMRIRTFVKKMEAALAAGDKGKAQEAFAEVVPELMRGVTKGVLHRNTASRKISRLNAQLKAIPS